MTAAGDWSPYGPRHHRHQNPFRHHLIVGLTAGLMVGAAVGAAGTRLAFVLAMPSAFVCASLPVAPHGDARPVVWRIDEPTAFACTARN